MGLCVYLGRKVVGVMRNAASPMRGVPKRSRARRNAIVGLRGNGHVPTAAADVRELADVFGAELVRAVRNCAAQKQYHVGTSRGSARGSAVGISWYAFALEYLDMRWPKIAAKTRNETNEALCAITQAMLRDMRGRPSDELLHRALRDWAFVVPRPEPGGMPTDVRLVLRWVAGASRPLADMLDPAVMRAVLEVLCLKQDGTVAAAETQRHKRMTLVNAVGFAIEQRRLPADPLAAIRWRIAKTVQQVDPRVSPTPPRPAPCSAPSPTSAVGGARVDRGWSGCLAACTTPGCGPRRRSR